MTYTKQDIDYHSDRSERRPAVNVKVRDSLEDGYRSFTASENPDPRFTLDWIRDNVDEEALQAYFGWACEAGWEQLEELAREIYGQDTYPDRYGARKYRVNVYSEGRQGGWAVIHGINLDVETWDAIELSRWRKFEKGARAEADDIMYQVVWQCYYNAFDAWASEQEDASEANSEIPVDLVRP